MANEWAARYPDGFRVIDKENGGHGSGINAGIDAAKGRYYKVIDSDDWILTENLKAILDAVENSSADIVSTGFHTVNMATGVSLAYGAGEELKEIPLSEFVGMKEEILSAQMFHGLMYNTEFYRNSGIRMSEGVFFEDQEYAILPFMHAGSILLIPLFLYEYQTGSATQSVNFANQGQKSGHLLTVLKKLIEHYSDTPMDNAQKEYAGWRIGNVITSYYAAVLVKSSEKKAGRVKASEFRQYVSQAAPEIALATDKKYETLMKLNRIPGASALYARLFGSGLYKSFKKRWIK